MSTFPGKYLRMYCQHLHTGRIISHICFVLVFCNVTEV